MDAALAALLDEAGAPGDPGGGDDDPPSADGDTGEAGPTT
jgi:hypothetical protein